MSTGELVAWYALDYIIDIFFLVDMVLRARRFHSVQDDRVIDLPSQIWKKYTLIELVKVFIKICVIVSCPKMGISY